MTFRCQESRGPMSRVKKFFSIVSQKPAVVPRVARALALTYLTGKAQLRGAELAVTYRCQATCDKCSTRSLIQNGRPEMSVEQVAAIANMLSRAGAVLIDLTGGEPLLRRDIDDIVRRLSRLPVILSMATNGLLLNEERLRSFKKNGLHVIQFGLSSPEASEHDAVIGVPGGYGRITDAIELTRRQGMEVLINTVVTKELLHSDKLGRMVRWAQERSCFLSLIMPASVGGWAGRSVGLDKDDYEKIKVWLKQPFVTTDTETCYQKNMCPAGKEKVYISAYGDLYPCPFIQQKAGNLFEGDFKKLWRSMHNVCYDRCVNVGS